MARTGYDLVSTASKRFWPFLGPNLPLAITRGCWKLGSRATTLLVTESVKNSQIFAVSAKMRGIFLLREYSKASSRNSAYWSIMWGRADSLTAVSALYNLRIVGIEFHLKKGWTARFLSDANALDFFCTYTIGKGVENRPRGRWSQITQ